MDKNSAEHIPCTYCEKDSLPDTYPPVCEVHAKIKQASADDEPATLKELSAK